MLSHRATNTDRATTRTVVTSQMKKESTMSAIQAGLGTSSNVAAMFMTLTFGEM